MEYGDPRIEEDEFWQYITRQSRQIAIACYAGEISIDKTAEKIRGLILEDREKNLPTIE